MTNRDNTNGRNSIVARSFSKYARGYDRHARLQKQMAERLASFLPNIMPDQVLEIGCGTGLFTQHLLAHPLKQLILNDIAADMVERLQSKLTLPRYCRVEVGNAETMEFQAVDLITANAVFQWFKLPLETLKIFNSYLRPDGELIFSTFGPATLAEFRKTASIESPASLLTFIKWKELIHEAGFSLRSSASETRKSFFSNTLGLLKNLQQIGAAPYRMTSSSDLRRLIKEYDENYSTKQGVYATWELFYFSAKKP
jgi:malonyl-CoA O-methyltransferase